MGIAGSGSGISSSSSFRSFFIDQCARSCTRTNNANDWTFSAAEVKMSFSRTMPHSLLAMNIYVDTVK